MQQRKKTAQDPLHPTQHFACPCVPMCRMESTSSFNCVHVSEPVQQRVGGDFWTPTNGIMVKGKGMMNTFLWDPALSSGTPPSHEIWCSTGFEALITASQAHKSTSGNTVPHPDADDDATSSSVSDVGIALSLGTASCFKSLPSSRLPPVLNVGLQQVLHEQKAWPSPTHSRFAGEAAAWAATDELPSAQAHNQTLLSDAV